MTSTPVTFPAADRHRLFTGAQTHNGDEPLEGHAAAYVLIVISTDHK